jgi:hypothetical protein
MNDDNDVMTSIIGSESIHGTKDEIDETSKMNINNNNNVVKIIDVEELKKILKKREFVYKELISTEYTYIERLKGFHEVIIQPLLTQNILSSNDYQNQFHNFNMIYELHCKYYQKFQQLTSIDYSQSSPSSSPQSLTSSSTTTTQEIISLAFKELFTDICNNFQLYSDYLGKCTTIIASITTTIIIFIIIIIIIIIIISTVNYELAMQRRGHLLIYNRKFYEFIEKFSKG